jgi:GWxTD domain-containing protein
MTDLGARNSALVAVHFYTAVAQAELGNDVEAKEALEAFFVLQPKATLDKSRYSAKFATLFETARKETERAASRRDSFDDAYPGFDTFTGRPSMALNRWGTSTESILLATDDEKAQWNRLTDDAARAEFVQSFWKKRDPDPSTPANEVRDEILRRIAYADLAFDEIGDRRGSLSDRGRVFVVLGKPQRVQTRPLTRREASVISGRGLVSGAMERWFYRHEQLPTNTPLSEISFRFMSTGMNQREMQNDFLALNTFNAAIAPLRLNTPSKWIP